VPEPTTDPAASESEQPTPPTGTPTEEPSAPAPSTDAPEPTPPVDAPASAVPPSQMPEYKGEPLDAERGPGLGCFWIQIVLLTFFLIFTPLTVTWGWDPFISGALLIITLVLLLFSGQTIIFLLRLVAADRRARRAPLSPTAKPTVGQMEDVAPATTTEATDDESGIEAPASADAAGAEDPPSTEKRVDG
jgi:hypothetical protein